MQAITARYPIGGAVTAYVSPDDPALAVLERGASALAVVMLLAGAVGAGRLFVVLARLAPADTPQPTPQPALIRQLWPAPKADPRR